MTSFSLPEAKYLIWYDVRYTPPLGHMTCDITASAHLPTWSGHSGLTRCDSCMRRKYNKHGILYNYRTFVLLYVLYCTQFRQLQIYIIMCFWPSRPRVGTVETGPGARRNGEGHPLCCASQHPATDTRSHTLYTQRPSPPSPFRGHTHNPLRSRCKILSIEASQRVLQVSSSHTAKYTLDGGWA